MVLRRPRTSEATRHSQPLAARGPERFVAALVWHWKAMKQLLLLTSDASHLVWIRLRLLQTGFCSPFAEWSTDRGL